MNEWLNGRMNERMHEWMREMKWNEMEPNEMNWNEMIDMNEGKNEWMNEWSNECMNESLKQWMHEWMNETKGMKRMNAMKWMKRIKCMKRMAARNEVTEWYWINECMIAWMLEGREEGKRNEWKVDFVLIFFVRARRIAFARAGWRVVSWADSWWSNDSKGLHSSTQILIIFFLQPLRACGTWYGNANGIQASDSPVDATNVGTTSEWFFIQGHPLVLRCFFSVWFGPCSSTRMAYDGIVLGKPSPRYSPVDVSSTTFADRGPKPRKQRPYYFGNCGSHFTRKNAGFRARQSFQAWTHTFPTCYISQLWHVDVVDMMVRMHENWECWPWQSSVPRKFTN